MSRIANTKHEFELLEQFNIMRDYVVQVAITWKNECYEMKNSSIGEKSNEKI